MNKNKNVPGIRFKGFSDGWKSSQLKELTSYSGLGTSPPTRNKTYFGGRIPCLKISDIDNNGCFINKTEKKITQLALDCNVAKIYPKGTISLAITFSYGKVVIINMDCVTSEAFYNIGFKSNALRDFIFWKLKWIHQSNYWNKLVLIGVKPYLNLNIVKGVTVSLTSEDEMKKIANLFFSFENLLESTRSKISKLENCKEALLNNMFPKTNQDKPDIRFKGFDKDWKIFAINDIFKITHGCIINEKQVSQVCNDLTPYPVYSSKTLNNGIFGYYKEFLYQDAITWTAVGYAGTVRYRQGKFYCTDICGVLLKKTMKPDYMISEALNKVTHNYVIQGTLSLLSNNVMAEIEVKLPTEEKEREKMSDIFSKIDNLTNLLKQKENKLNLVKENLLNKMFC
ncbi:restriction endonuclease subunit S [Mycoplasma bradburyae]|uniref:restriction endonuclease subunit S n=1 Tax=Mycoplasma bradburyae TaxID=2963128 RepID=UPI0023415879|nr:restriction endonuclease subunit S [Mycoplasma bradburyae]MDC4184324.1 restriction endonuclease subunit S [Mycoplasma bradburyae]